ncbi:MAG TPA: transglycosylase SLT domain-containing protein [Rhodanobacteraceae bacterium]
MLQRVKWMACVAVSATLAGCAGAPAHTGSATGVNGLYAQLRQASAQYDQALEQARRGDHAQSEKTLEAALDAMRTASDQCVNTAGCDTARFLSAYDRALRLKDGSFLGTEDDDAMVDSDDAGELGTSRSTGLPQAQRTEQLLKNHKLSDLVATNGTVQAALQVWLTRLRPQLIRSYVDYQYLRSEMWPQFHAAGLPEAVLFGIMAKESGGNVHAVSRSGAAGPLQFMPATGARFGLNTVDGFDQRFDPTMAAKATAAYLNQQLGQLNDNLALVLAAYNGGEGRVGRLASGTPDASFWDPSIYFALSPETREYVPMVLAAAWLYLHPERYNLRFPRVDGAPGYVALTNPATLNELSVCLGDEDGARFGWFRTLRNLNPQVMPDQILAQGTRVNLPKFLERAYKQSCVTGKWVALATTLQNAQLPTPPASVIAADDPPPARHDRHRGRAHYTVRRGDTLYAIAQKFHCDSVRQLVRNNHMHSESDLQVGKRLNLDGCRR